MDENKELPIASREEVQEFFEEEQQLSDQEKQANVAEAAEEAKEQVKRVAFNSANIIGLINSKDGTVLDWMYKTLPPQNGQVEVIPPAGAPKKGGGSKSRRKKDKKGNKAYVDPWTGI